jgi:hypothetical protein
MPSFVIGHHGDVTRLGLVGINKLLLNVKTSTNVGWAIRHAGGTSGDGIGDMISNMRKIISHGIEQHDREEVFFLWKTNSVYALNEFGKHGGSDREAFTTMKTG